MTFDTDPIAEAWFQKVLKGVVRMTSVGFMPHEWSVESETRGRGDKKREVLFIDVPESELLEISVVPIGANTGALIGQALYASLLERVNAAEQQTAALLRAVETFVESEKSAATNQVRDRLLSVAARFK